MNEKFERRREGDCFERFSMAELGFLSSVIILLCISCILARALKERGGKKAGTAAGASSSTIQPPTKKWQSVHCLHCIAIGLVRCFVGL